VEKIFSMLMEIPAVVGVGATRVKGAVKHYNIQVEGNVDKLASLWPFCNITANDNGTVADYIVRPDEINAFYSNLSRKYPRRKRKEVAILLQFNGPLTDEIRRRVAMNIRGSDRTIWGDDRVAIILGNRKEEAVKAVQERIKLALSEDCRVTFSVQVS